MNNVYKFVSWDVPELDTLKNCDTYKIMEKLNNGKSLSREEKDHFPFINGCYVNHMGWRFDFRPFCNRYLVHIRNCGWHEVWHFDKTAIRKNYSNILEIVQIG